MRNIEFCAVSGWVRRYVAVVALCVCGVAAEAQGQSAWLAPRTLDARGVCRGFASAINDVNQIVGAQDDGCTEFVDYHAVAWWNAESRSDLLRSSSSAADINNAGWVVGTEGVGVFSAGRPMAFLLPPTGGILRLGTLGGARSEAAAINDAQHVVGWSDLASGRERAFLWTPTVGMVDLGTLGGLRSWAYDINASGQVQVLNRVGTGADQVVADFGAAGLWQYSDAVGWTQLHALSPVTVTAGRFY